MEEYLQSESFKNMIDATANSEIKSMFENHLASTGGIGGFNSSDEIYMYYILRYQYYYEGNEYNG